MRFFAHDGSTVHGPAGVAELVKLPGFDGDTLVCPVGSERSSDWKPALAYPAFRHVLLAAPPKPAAPTKACPRCGYKNPERARYCNECGARMDGREPPAEPAPESAPMSTLKPTPAPLDALEFSPAAPEPGSKGPSGAIPTSEPPKPEPAPSAPESGLSAPAAHEPPPARPSETIELPTPTVEAPPAAPADAASLRKTLLAAFIGAAAASGALGFWLLRPRAPKAPESKEITLTPPPAESAPAPAAPAPAAPAAPIAETTPAPATRPSAAAPAAPPSSPAPFAGEKPAKRPAHRPKRAKKPAPAPKPSGPIEPAASGDDSLIESRVDAIPSPAPAAEKPAAKAAATPTGAAPESSESGFMLPGVPKRVTAKPLAKSPAAKPAPPSAASAPPAPPSDGGAAPSEDGAARQVREQFEFCAQLLAQGAYDDHFDTCLCAEARQAAPYRGRRGTYAATLQKAAKAGLLETRATATSVVLDGAIAKVTAKWTRGSSSSEREVVQSWRLEDGLWCRAP